MYLVAALAWSIALQPGEVAAGVDVEEVGLRRVPNVHGDIVMTAQKQHTKFSDTETASALNKQTNPAVEEVKKKTEFAKLK